MIHSALALVVLLAGLWPVAAVKAQGLPPVPFPPGNPPTTAKALLGKALFWDEQLSSTRTVACGTCHIPGGGTADPRTLSAGSLSMHPGLDASFGTPDDVGGSFGVPANDAGGQYLPSAFGMSPQVTPRRTQGVIMAAYSPMLFWDGRASGEFRDPVTNAVLLPALAALESQALGPFLNEIEMGHAGRTLTDLLDRVNGVAPLAMATNLPATLDGFVNGRSYPDLFQAAFGTRDVTPARIAMALATYQRELVPDQSPFDLGTMDGFARAGEQVFRLVGRCALCHVPPLFTDHNFLNLGVRPVAEDIGRAAVTSNPADRGSFRMPSLRNVGLRGPFFHNGRFRTLAELVEFYDRGGDFPPSTTPAITPIGMTVQQKRDLVSFLEALTDPRVAQELPPFDRPTLFSESTRVPAKLGSPSPGDGGFLPRVVALEPAILGNPRWTVALERATGGMPAWMLLSTGGDPVGISVLGAMLHVTPGPGLVGFLAGFVAGSAPGAGTLSLTLQMPNESALRGLTMYGQWWVLNTVAPTPLAASQAFSIPLF